ncbi:MAG: hypothetical protein IPN38_12160 [Flavobacteriales bacterium]|nr:hypothetical protein [Flavobacteriales bacterium]
MRASLLLAFGLSFSVPLHAQLARTAAEVPVVVLSSAVDLRSSVQSLPSLQRAGLSVSAVAGEGCYVGRAEASSIAALRAVPGVLSVVTAQSDDALVNALPPGQRIGVRYLNALLAGTFETPAVRAPMDWSAHPAEHALEPPHHSGAMQRGNDLRGGNTEAIDWTCGESYNSETMEGVVVASTFFIESNGAIDTDQYTWTQADIDNVKLQVIDAWSIWSYTASLNGRTVTAVMDWYEPAGGMSLQGYEPVTRSGSSDYLWIEAIMNNLGRTEAGAFGKLYGFNHDRRGALAADRSFSCFVAYNPGSAPSQFTDGRIGYAYLGGPYTQILWRANGWSSSQIQRVYGHEVGHIFHAFDEYSSSSTSNCTRSFNGRTNSNYQGSTCNGTSPCVMINNAFSGSGATRTWNLCSHTPYHLGWQGVLNQPICNSPINDVIVTTNPVVLRWNRSGAPVGTSGYIKVYERTTDSLVYCGNMSTVDTLALNVLNGQYRWLVSVGSGGYAGVLGAPALFTVNAPLNATFSRSPGTICAGATVLYTNTSTGAPNSWSWSFPGGVPSAWTGKFPPAVRYDLPGTYSATLTVGDGLTTDVETLSSSVTVSGGSALPFLENFNGAVFPPAGWTSQSGGGVGQGGTPLDWTGVTEPACSQVKAASVQAFTHTGTYAYPMLKSPRLDLTQSTIPYVRFKYSYVRKSTTPGGSVNVWGNNCSFSRYAELWNKADSALSVNGGVPISSPAWTPAACTDWKEMVFRLDSLKGHIAELSFRFGVPGPDQNFHLDDVAVFEGIRVNVRVLLDGPLDVQTGLMGDALRTAALLPSAEPYTALGYAWKGEGGPRTVSPAALAVTGANALVDWVVLELRDATDPTRVLASAACLVQRDGDLVDVNGTSAVRMPVPQGNYYIAVRHRNHLPVCTASTVAVSTGMPLLDLSAPATPTWGTNARKSNGSYATLWSGDDVRNNTISYTGQDNDRDAILLRIGGTIPTNTVTGYYLEDTNMDGVVKYTGGLNDRDLILFNIGGSVPTNVRVGQIP